MSTFKSMRFLLRALAGLVVLGAMAGGHVSVGKDNAKNAPTVAPGAPKAGETGAKAKDQKAGSAGDSKAKAEADKDKPGEARVEETIVCPKNLPPIPNVSRSDVYKNTPYKQGERTEYEVRYAGALAGTGILEVKSPYKYKGPYKKPIWHRNFHADAKTGDWYRLIFVAHDKLDALVRPWDWGISRFYMEQDEGQMFGKRLEQKKWLDFNHARCKVSFRRTKKGKKERTEEFDLAYGAMDTLGVAFWLREQEFKLNKKVRTLVYSSEANWWLEATPTAFEELTLKEGKFKAVKLNLQTYIGQELQQKGNVDIWIATEHPARPLLQVKAEIKIGSIWIEMVKFKPGK